MGDHCASVMSAVYCGSSISNSAARNLRLMLTGGFFISHRDENTEYLLITVTCRHSQGSEAMSLSVGGKGPNPQPWISGPFRSGGGVWEQACQCGHLRAMCENKHPSDTRAPQTEKRRMLGVGKEVGIHYVSSTFSSSAPVARDSKHWLLPWSKKQLIMCLVQRGVSNRGWSGENGEQRIENYTIKWCQCTLQWQDFSQKHLLSNDREGHQPQDRNETLNFIF